MSSFFDFDYKIIDPDPRGIFSEQVKDCAQQLGKLYEGLDEKAIIVRANWFFRISKDSSCTKIHSSVLEAMSSEGLLTIPFTIVAERPVGENHVQLVVCIIENFQGEVLSEAGKSGENVYCRVKYDNQEWLFTGGSGCFEEEQGIRESSNRAFVDVKSVMALEGFSFSSILRQWNYIPGIVEEETNDDGQVIQHYQEFNDVRAEWYHKEGLKQDFPAATGIGVAGGGVVIEVIAFKSDIGHQILTLHNPEQSDAHRYSPIQLVGAKAFETPRFERGKLIISKGKGHIWVSGTAAIRGEDSVPGNIVEQSRITCENIEALISRENLLNAGLEAGDYSTQPIYIRAYVKLPEHGQMVQQYLEKRYRGASIHVLQANVCRDELLVEVEGEFSIRQCANE